MLASTVKMTDFTIILFTLWLVLPDPVVGYWYMSVQTTRFRDNYSLNPKHQIEEKTTSKHLDLSVFFAWWLTRQLQLFSSFNVQNASVEEFDLECNQNQIWNSPSKFFIKFWKWFGCRTSSKLSRRTTNSKLSSSHKKKHRTRCATVVTQILIQLFSFAYW